MLLLLLGLGLGHGGGSVDVYDNGGGGFGGVTSLELMDKSHVEIVSSLRVHEDIVLSSDTAT